MNGASLATAFAGLTLEAGVATAMRDGVKLIADIYRPDGPGPWPVLLMRQPYGRDLASTITYAHPTWWARQGFLVVIQDVRGRGDSEGDFYPFRAEIEDGADTVAWAASLPGSNGRVGMYGFSYQGYTQLAAAAAQPPALKAIAPHMTAFDLYNGWFYRNGILQLYNTVDWGSQMLCDDVSRLDALSAAAIHRTWGLRGSLSAALPVAEAEPITAADVPPYVADWLRHPHRDAYWEAFNLLPFIDGMKLPMFHLSGWFDMYLRGSVAGFRAMAGRHPDQILMAGPWAHLPWTRQVAGVDLGPAAEPTVNNALATWFHHWLDHETPAEEITFAPVRYFVLGTNHWAESTSWPPVESAPQTWFLQSTARANSSFGDGVLSLAGASGPEDIFVFDPEFPVAAPGGNQAGVAAFGPHDLSGQQQENTLLIYTAPPVEAPFTVAGDAQCVLHVRSSAPTTHFVARLSLVAPSGTAQFLTLGAGVAQADGEFGACITINFDPIAVCLQPHEAIRLDIASSAFPLLVRSPNTTDDPARVSSPAEFERAIQVVYHDSDRPSRLILPVIAA